MVHYKTVDDRHYGTLHNSKLHKSMLHYFQKQFNLQKNFKSVNTEEKSTNLWIGSKFGLTYSNPGYGQSQSTNLHQPMD